jgi:hypothetical protein
MIDVEEDEKNYDELRRNYDEEDSDSVRFIFIITSLGFDN